MKTHTLIIFTLCLTSCLGGCAKIRQMTRRDFAVLNDPFLDSPASAAPGAAPGAAQLAANTSTAAEGNAGFARVGASQTVSAGAPTRTAGNAANPFQMASQSRTVVPDSTTSGVARIASGQPATMNSVPESKSMDMADMSAFMKQQAEASGLTETAANLEEDFAAFAAARQEEWKKNVQRVKEKSNSKVRQVVDQGITFGESEMPSIPGMAFGDNFEASETAQPLIRQMSAQATAATQPVKEMPNPFEDQTGPTEANPFASVDFSENPFAFEQPVAAGDRKILDTTRARATPPPNPAQELDDFAAFAQSQLTGKVATKPADHAEVNPFEQWQPQPQTQQAASGTGRPTTRASEFSLPAAPTQKQDKLDQNFGFDVGWRPANMERP